ncbi:TauD/TfdA family dioxygenase [Actinomycetota bacterium Odt1-20B]
MSAVPPQTRELFTHHLVDIASPGAVDKIVLQLRDTGLVTVEGITSRAVMLDFVRQFMTITWHRDSDTDGLTTVCASRREALGAGFAGFSSGELAPHTDRSSTPHPPRLMMFVNARPAATGGESLLYDGRAVHADLLAGAPDACTALSQPNTAYFGAGDGHTTQIFTPHPGHRVSMRLRMDEGRARFSPVISPHLPQLHQALVNSQWKLALAEGQGYLVDNARWLHGRRAFTGERLCWRALGEPRFSLLPGFSTAHGTGAGPRDDLVSSQLLARHSSFGTVPR